MGRKTVYIVAALLLAFASADATSRKASERLQVIYREDSAQGVWNVYVFGTVCEEGKLILHEPKEPRTEPLRVECILPRR